MSSKSALGPFADPELDALVTACHTAYRSPSSSLGLDLDWDRFLQLAQHHRVEAVAWRGLGKLDAPVPAKIADAFQRRAREIAATNLQLISESARLRDIFDRAGIPILFVKGATLAKIAFEDVAIKSAIDVDILVRPNDLLDAARLLTEAGYRLASPRSPDRLIGWHRLRKESLWLHEETGLAVDLHSRLADSPALIADIWTEQSVRYVTVASGLSLPTPKPDELAAYLAVHGATSAWFRLKWLVDFAAVLEREHEGGIGNLRARMAQLGAHRAGDQALHLADLIFGSLDSDVETRVKVAREWPTRSASMIARSYLRRSEEPTQRFGGTLGIHASSLLILSSATDRLRQVAAKIRMAMPANR